MKFPVREMEFSGRVFAVRLTPSWKSKYVPYHSLFAYCHKKMERERLDHCLYGIFKRANTDQEKDRRVIWYPISSNHRLASYLCLKSLLLLYDKKAYWKKETHKGTLQTYKEGKNTSGMNIWNMYSVN